MIHMQQNFNKLQFLVGNQETLEHANEIPVKEVLDNRVIDFLGDLSKQILKDPRVKSYPDVVTYAFWIRKNALLKMKERYASEFLRVGRGMAFHIAPSNVAVSFALSFTSALLAGNASVVRVSNKAFVQVEIIADAISALYDTEYSDMKPYLTLVRYEHDEEITQALSDICDIRIIWGGNQTIEIIRKASLKPRAVELTFADRHSIALIDADVYLSGNSEAITKDFYLDSYYSDQNACSAPRIVVWIGTQKDKAKQMFWSCLRQQVEKEYEFKPIMAIDKLTALCRLAAEHDNIAELVEQDNKMCRVRLKKLIPELMDYKTGGGYFFEYDAEDLREIIPILGKSCQTVGYYGIDPIEIKKLLFETNVRGIDRIVPLGHTMDLSVIWDGYNMLDTMSRVVDIF